MDSKCKQTIHQKPYQPMKQLLSLNYFKTLLMCLLCLSSLQSFAQGNNDSDDTVPPTTPPKKNPEAAAATILSNPTGLTIIFSEEADELLLEVLSDQGATVYVATGAVATNSSVWVDTQCWRKGHYTVRLSVKGKSSRTSTILVR